MHVLTSWLLKDTVTLDHALFFRPLYNADSHLPSMLPLHYTFDFIKNVALHSCRYARIWQMIVRFDCFETWRFMHELMSLRYFSRQKFHKKVFMKCDWIRGILQNQWETLTAQVEKRLRIRVFVDQLKILKIKIMIVIRRLLWISIPTQDTHQISFTSANSSISYCVWGREHRRNFFACFEF